MWCSCFLGLLSSVTFFFWIHHLYFQNSEISKSKYIIFRIERNISSLSLLFSFQSEWIWLPIMILRYKPLQLSETVTEVLYKNRCSYKYRKIQVENPCVRVFFLIKLQACDFIKKRLWHSCFLVSFAIFLRTPFLQNISGWLLLRVALLNRPN